MFSENAMSDGSTSLQIKEIQVRSKIDRYILPLLVFLYLFSFLDRASIGNAKVAGMDVTLNMKPSDFNWGISIFFAGYVLWEIPSNCILKNWRASRLIPLITIIWATITIGLSLVKNGLQLMIVRFLLGVAEAGLFPGILYYLTLWYTRHELALRFAIFFGAATLAGAFGGLLAAAIVQLDGKFGVHGWQWIFIIEGLATIVFGIIGFFFLPDSPKNAWFLTEEERQIGEDRVKHDNNVERANFSTVVSVIGDWKAWFYAITSFCGSVAFYSISLFLPSIVNGLGFNRIVSQALTAPPYVVSFILLILNALHSDTKQERGVHTAIPLLCGAIGYTSLLFIESIAWKYLVLCLTVGLLIAYIPIILSWVSNNFANSSRRAIALAWITSINNVAGFVAGQVYRDTDKPKYLHGHTTCAVLCFVGFVSALLLKVTLKKANEKRIKKSLDQAEEKTLKKQREGDRARDFRYIS